MYKVVIELYSDRTLIDPECYEVTSYEITGFENFRAASEFITFSPKGKTICAEKNFAGWSIRKQ